LGIGIDSTDTHRKNIGKNLEQNTTEQNTESPASLVFMLEIDKYSTY